MITPSRRQAILFLLLCSALPYEKGKAQQKPQKYGKSLFLGLTHIQTNDGCLTIGATISAAEFFTNLQKVQTGSIVEFRKGPNVITTFPEKIAVNLSASGFAFERDCRDKTAPVETVGKVALMKSLQFETFWQHGSVTTPATILSRQMPSNPIMFGSYTLSVRSGDVPLTDHFVVQIVDGTGREIVSFSAAL